MNIKICLSKEKKNEYMRIFILEKKIQYFNPFDIISFFSQINSISKYLMKTQKFGYKVDKYLLNLIYKYFNAMKSLVSPK